MSQEKLKVGTIIKQICDSKGISVRQCEQMAGIPTRTISRWDDNQPSIGKVAAVASALGVPIETLLGLPVPGEKENPATDGDEVVDEADALIQAEKDRQLLAFFRSLPPEKLKAILISQDGPEELA